MDLLRFVTAGSVDDGKSTLIGRLLYDTKQVFEDTLAGIQRASEARGFEEMNLALLTDGLRAEREQGITIDVAYRYFATPRRKFILADSPGHVQYTRNMVTGASTADLALVLVDARTGVVQQTRRHSLLAALLRIRQLVLCVNKMDLVDWDEARFREIEAEYREFAARLRIAHVAAIPVAALYGENVAERSDAMPWYEGPTLLELLESVDASRDRRGPLRFPIQYVIRPQSPAFPDYRGYAGTIAEGRLSVGDEVAVLPGGRTTRVTAIEAYRASAAEATAGDAVSVRLADELDISRGHLLADPLCPPAATRCFTADLCWMADERKLAPRQHFWLKHTTRRVRCTVESLESVLDVESLESECRPAHFALNDIGRVTLRTLEPVFLDPYEESRAGGSFVLIDPATHHTVAAAMVREVMPEEAFDAAV